MLMLSVPPAMITPPRPAMIRSAASAIACRPDEQNRLMVIAEHVTGSPARNDAMRATLFPCCGSGMAQPRITSSTSAASSPGTRLRASLMAAAAKSSGRVLRSVPRGALPTAVRAVETINASFMLASLVGVGILKVQLVSVAVRIAQILRAAFDGMRNVPCGDIFHHNRILTVSTHHIICSEATVAFNLNLIAFFSHHLGDARRLKESRKVKMIAQPTGNGLESFKLLGCCALVDIPDNGFVTMRPNQVQSIEFHSSIVSLLDI